MEVLITIELLSMTFMNLIYKPLSGKNQKQKEILQNQEEAMLQVYLQIKINYSFSEDGISLCNSAIFLFMILNLKHGLILR
jgi:hypothetical protein